MSTEQKDLEQNALATRLNRFWGNFKQGKIVGYKWMALLLLLGAGIGVTWYVIHERRKASSQRWMDLDEASTPSALEEISKKYPNTPQDWDARLQNARNLLGEAGIEQLGTSNPDQKKKAIENVEKARELFQQLLDHFKDDPVLKAECLYALAKAEMALVAVPTKEGQLTEFKGSTAKVVELLDQLVAAAAPDTPWATDGKKLADALRDPNSATAHDFFKVEQALSQRPNSTLPKTDPFGPSGPFGPGGMQFPKSPGIPGGP